MCSSRPKIPNNKTPPAPLAPEASPDAPTISERGQYYRSQGIRINTKQDLSGLGNQDVGKPINRLLIRPDQNTPINVNDQITDLENQITNQPKPKPKPKPFGANRR